MINRWQIVRALPFPPKDSAHSLFSTASTPRALDAVDTGGQGNLLHQSAKEVLGHPKVHRRQPSLNLCFFRRQLNF